MDTTICQIVILLLKHIVYTMHAAYVLLCLPPLSQKHPLKTLYIQFVSKTLISSLGFLDANINKATKHTNAHTHALPKHRNNLKPMRLLSQCDLISFCPAKNADQPANVFCSPVTNLEGTKAEITSTRCVNGHSTMRNLNPTRPAGAENHNCDN